MFWPWFYLLLWTENYYTAAAVASIELFPWEGCCELEVLTTKQLILHETQACALESRKAHNIRFSSTEKHGQ